MFTPVQIIAASSYAATSVLILLSNKMILSTYHFHYPFLMSLSHMIVGLLLLQLGRVMKVITHAPFDLALAKKALPVSLCFIANCVLGMMALRGTNVPMFATLRRLTVAMVMLCELLVLRKIPSKLTITSVSIMVLGSFIGGWADLQFEWFGYAMVLLNNLLTALNLVFIKKTLNDTRLSSDTFGMLYYNSILSIPFLALFTLLSGEIWSIGEFPYLYDTSFQAAFLLSAIMSFLMNYSTYWCTEVNSALTTSVTGQVKNVLSSFLSLFLGNHSSGVGVKPTPMLVFGLTTGLCGSFIYAYALAQQQASKKPAAVAQELSSLKTVESIPEEEIGLLGLPAPMVSRSSDNSDHSALSSPNDTPLSPIRSIANEPDYMHARPHHGVNGTQTS